MTFPTIESLGYVQGASLSPSHTTYVNQRAARAVRFDPNASGHGWAAFRTARPATWSIARTNGTVAWFPSAVAAALYLQEHPDHDPV